MFNIVIGIVNNMVKVVVFKVLKVIGIKLNLVLKLFVVVVDC